MEWPKELLDIFEDPLLDDVRPKATAPTANDRLAMKLVEITDWVESHGREPQKTGDLQEKLLFASLKSIRNNPNKVSLKPSIGSIYWRNNMDIDKELEDILNDPLLEMTEKERSLFEIPEDMKKVIEKKRSKADYDSSKESLVKIFTNISLYLRRFMKTSEKV